MRVTKQVMAKNNANITEAAARLFREKGVDNTSISNVMTAAGLTHGGFYRHFKSKDELIIAAIEKIFKTSADLLRSTIDEQGAEFAINAFIQQYLSKTHIDELGNGCPLAGCPLAILGGEENKKSLALKNVLCEGKTNMVHLLTKGIKGAPEQRYEKATGLFAILIGSIILARSSKTDKMQNEVLTSGMRLANLCINSDLNLTHGIKSNK